MCAYSIVFTLVTWGKFLVIFCLLHLLFSIHHVPSLHHCSLSNACQIIYVCPDLKWTEVNKISRCDLTWIYLPPRVSGLEHMKLMLFPGLPQLNTVLVCLIWVSDHKIHSVCTHSWTFFFFLVILLTRYVLPSEYLWCVLFFKCISEYFVKWIPIYYFGTLLCMFGTQAAFWSSCGFCFRTITHFSVVH